ncbi:MAG: hypothetical protein CM15mP112_00130 [Flavobacteriales bacterium]|nr:MAG: hypothetical protein CM15mP112_00130 [Flavobacteriales bacterium]
MKDVLKGRDKEKRWKCCQNEIIIGKQINNHYPKKIEEIYIGKVRNQQEYGLG